MHIHVHYVDDSRLCLKLVEETLLASNDLIFDAQKVSFSFEGFLSSSAYQEAIATDLYSEPTVILIDLSMHGEERAGLKLAQIARTQFPLAKIFMLTQYYDANTVVTCMASGCDNFFTKGEDFSSLAINIVDTLRLCLTPPGVADKQDNLEAYAGKTMRDLSSRVPKIVQSAVRSVHILGETGTGKEIVADLFEAALGGKKPFIRINCGAIQSSLMESELFGHVKGAFTGASADKIGIFEAASGGWLFLDEVALLSPDAQRCILRAIENQEISRIGERRKRKIDVRVISATNESLSAAVDAGRFRRDLWQRLSETLISLPPLRERMTELADIINFFAKNLEGGPYIIPPTTFAVLQHYNWREGNIRELRNTMRSMTEFAIACVLWPSAVPTHLYQKMVCYAEATKSDISSRCEINLPFDKELFDFGRLEEELLLQVLKLFVGSDGKINLLDLHNQFKMPKATFRRRVRHLVNQGKISDALFV